MFVTQTTWNRYKKTPQPETILKPADFIPCDPEMTPQGPTSTSASITLFDESKKETEVEMLYGSSDRLIFSSLRFIYTV